MLTCDRFTRRLGVQTCCYLCGKEDKTLKSQRIGKLGEYALLCPSPTPRPVKAFEEECQLGSESISDESI